jgi:hypothetical protein
VLVGAVSAGGAEGVVAVLVTAVVDVVASVELAVVERELVVVAGESGFTTTNWDFVLSQVAHASGFGGSNSTRPTVVSQQSAVWSQQNEVSLLVTLLQDIRSGPIPAAMFQRPLAANTIPGVGKDVLR